MTASILRTASLGLYVLDSASGQSLRRLATPGPTYDFGTPGPTYDFGTPGPTYTYETPAPTYDNGGTPSPTVAAYYHCEQYYEASTCITYQQHDDMLCQKDLTVQECVGFAASIEKEMQHHTDPNLQHGCMMQYIDEVVMWNDVQNAEYEMDWCAGGSCIVRAVCNQETWVTKYDGEPCENPLSEDECFAASQNNAMFWQDRTWAVTSEQTLPLGCYGDRFNNWVAFNAPPFTLWSDAAPDFYLPLCSEVGSFMPSPFPTPMTATPAPTPKVMGFLLRNQHGICLDAKRRRDRGGTVHMWNCQQSGEQDEWNKNQHWNLIVDSEDAEVVQGVVKSHDGICLDSSEAMNGGKVWMWPCSNSNKRQRWSYNKQTGQLMNANGYCLDARQRMTTGGKVHMWTCMGGNKNQKWSMFSHPGILDYYGSKMDYSQNILTTGTWMGYMPLDPYMPQVPPYMP